MKDLIEKANSGDREAISKLEKDTDGHPLFVEGDDGKLDVELSIKAIEAYHDFGMVPKRVGTDRKKPRHIRDILMQRETEHNPVTGELLVADQWQEVGQVVRLVVCYGTRHQRALSQYPEPELLDLAISGELEDKSAYKQMKAEYEQASDQERLLVKQFCFRRKTIQSPKSDDGGVLLMAAFRRNQSNVAVLEGGGAIAQGPGAVAAGRGGIAVSGDIRVGTGDPNDPVQLRNFIKSTFNLGEFKTLCFDMANEMKNREFEYDSIRGETLPVKIMHLVDKASRWSALDTLIPLVRNERAVQWVRTFGHK